MFDSSPFVVRWPMQRVGLGAFFGIIPNQPLELWLPGNSGNRQKQSENEESDDVERVKFFDFPAEYISIVYCTCFCLVSVYFIEWKILTLGILGQLHQPVASPRLRVVRDVKSFASRGL